MRILIVTHYWRPHWGGIETVAWEQARRLVQRGHEVSVLTSRLANDPAVLQEDGFPVYRITAANFLEARGIPYPIYSYRLLPQLARLVSTHDVTLIHGHTYISSVASVFVAKRYESPVVILQHNPFVQYRFPWNTVEHMADFLLGRYALRSAATVLAISQHTRRYVEKLIGPRPVEVLYNGVDTQRFTPVDSHEGRRHVRASLGLPSEGCLLFTVRRLVFRNGLDTLLAACCQLREHARILVVIGGSGPEQPVMERFINQEGLRNVRLVGGIPAEVLPDFYRAADAFVLPTRTGEGFGLVLLEAFASGLPAIATRGGAQEEVVEDGRTGLMVTPERANELAEAALLLSKQPDLVQKMGALARTRAEDMNWDRSLDRLEEILTQVARQ
jgi:D-inositol-3-phosphate glycosyltransferase